LWTKRNRFRNGQRESVAAIRNERNHPKALKHEVESRAYFRRPEVRNALVRHGWNRFRITCVGNKLKIEVNGVTTTDYQDDADAEGYIGLQHHGEEGQVYRFRKLRIKKIPTVTSSSR